MLGLGLPVWEMLMVLSLAAVAVSTLSVVLLQRQENQQRALEVAEANKSASEANEHAKELELALEKERVERLTLAAKYSPRGFDDAQAAGLVNQLGVLKGTRVDIVSYEGLGTDVAFLAQLISIAMRQAGVDAPVFSPMGGSGLVFGVVVRHEAGAEEQVVDAANLIVKSLRDAGLSSGLGEPFPIGEAIAGGYMGPDGVAPASKVRILVGAKPLQ